MGSIALMLVGMIWIYTSIRKEVARKIYTTGCAQAPCGAMDWGYRWESNETSQCGLFFPRGHSGSITPVTAHGAALGNAVLPV